MLHIAMPCICVAYCLHCIYCSPPFLPVDPAAAADDTIEYDDYIDDQTTIAELPSKQSPSPLPDITYLFRIILALGIAVVAD